jgi:Fur family ferric uptake transcriptional regulator/Fur family peroxide stress response transcriptional regulator
MPNLPDPTTSTAERDHELTDALRERGQRVTSQRLVIHRALRELNRHVTAEQVLDMVRPALPGVSLPTVYATLELFEELGTVRRISRAPGPALYDPRPEPHHHLVCTGCGRIDDVEATVDLAAVVRTARRSGFLPERSEVLVRGLCADCASGRQR